MGCYFLLQGILLTQGIFESLEFLQGNFLNLLHWQVFSRHLQIKLTKDRLVRKDRFLYMYMCVGVHRKMWLKEVVRIVCMPAQWLQWCLTLCNPMDCSPPGFSVHRILQARVLEWVVIPSSRGSSQSRDLTLYLLHGRQILTYCWAYPQGTSTSIWCAHRSQCLTRLSPEQMINYSSPVNEFTDQRKPECVTPKYAFFLMPLWHQNYFELKTFVVVWSVSCSVMSNSL